MILFLAGYPGYRDGDPKMRFGEEFVPVSSWISYTGPRCAPFPVMQGSALVLTISYYYSQLSGHLYMLHI